MVLEVVIGLLIVLLALESSYILIHHRPVSRFKTVGEDGLVAFDTATGQLCRTFPAKTTSRYQ